MKEDTKDMLWTCAVGVLIWTVIVYLVGYNLFGVR